METKSNKQYCGTLATFLLLVGCVPFIRADEPVTRAVVDGQGQGWRDVTGDDFVNVNCAADTWTWKDGALYCTGQPVGVMRSRKQYTNFELVCQWMHKKSAGNSGIFLWTTEESVTRLAEAGKGRVQV